MLRAFAGAFVVRVTAGAFVDAATLVAFVASCPLLELTTVTSAVQHAPRSFNLSLVILLHFRRSNTAKFAYFEAPSRASASGSWSGGKRYFCASVLPVSIAQYSWPMRMITRLNA